MPSPKENVSFHKGIGKNRNNVQKRLFLLQFHIVILMFAGTLSGCETSRLLSLPLNPAITKLENTSGPPIHLTLEIPKALKERLGGQYFLFLPLGKTGGGALEELTYNHIYQELLLMGYRPKLSPDEQTTAALRIILQEARVTSYDLLVSRLVKTEVALAVEWSGMKNQKSVARATRSEFHRLPFSKEVTREYTLALREALREAISRLK